MRKCQGREENMEKKGYYNEVVDVFGAPVESSGKTDMVEDKRRFQSPPVCHHLTSLIGKGIVKIWNEVIRDKK